MTGARASSHRSGPGAERGPRPRGGRRSASRTSQRLPLEEEGGDREEERRVEPCVGEDLGVRHGELERLLGRDLLAEVEVLEVREDDVDRVEDLRHDVREGAGLDARVRRRDLLAQGVEVLRRVPGEGEDEREDRALDRVRRRGEDERDRDDDDELDRRVEDRDRVLEREGVDPPHERIEDREPERHDEDGRHDDGGEARELPDDELAAPDRSGEDRVDGLPLDLLVDEVRPEEDRAERPEERDRRERRVGDDPQAPRHGGRVVAGRDRGEDVAEAAGRERGADDRVEDAIAGRLLERVRRDGGDRGEVHVFAPLPNFSTKYSSSVTPTGWKKTSRPPAPRTASSVRSAEARSFAVTSWWAPRRSTVPCAASATRACFSSARPSNATRKAPSFASRSFSTLPS